jgi:hypothetical protein
MELRPLGFGEIFDRAITLYLRNFIPIAGIVSVFIVPLAVLQYFLDRASMPQWDSMIRVLQHPSATPAPPPTPFFLNSPSTLILMLLLILVAWLLWPFALNACTVSVARLYRGAPIDFSACYLVSLAHWPRVLAMLLVQGVILLLWYLAFIIPIFLVLFGTVFLLRAAQPATSVIVVFVGLLVLLFMLAWLLFLSPLIVALSFGMNAIVIEGRAVGSALSLGFARVFNRREFWRALLFGVAAFAIVLGASTLVSVVAMIAMALHLIVVDVALSTLFRAAITPFSVVLLAVYYFDVRIRREGYEIEAELDRLADTAAVA